MSTAAADAPMTAPGSLTAAELIDAAIADDPDGHDPFEAFSLATGAAAADPHAYWRSLQDDHGVYPGRASPDGEPSMSDFMYGQREVYSVLRYEEASQVFRDGDTFSSSVLGESVGLVWGRTMIQMDDPEHGRYRRLIQQAFTRREMERSEHDIPRPLLRRYLDALRAAGRAELVRELLLAYPATVMGRAMGLPEADLPRFLRLTVEMTNIAFEPERALGASAVLAEYLRGQVEDRRTHPGGEDLLTGLVTVTLAAEDQASGAPAHLTDEEIVSFVRLLLIAGAETTARSSATMLLLLLRHPDQFAAVRADRGLIPAAVEETLRLEPPLNVSTRTSTRACAVGGGTGRGRRGAGDHRCRQPGSPALGRPRLVRSGSPAQGPSRLHLRRARLSGNAPRTDGDASDSGGGARPVARSRAGPGRRRGAHPGQGAPLATGASCGLREGDDVSTADLVLSAEAA